VADDKCVEGCGKPSHARGRCTQHYQQWYKANLHEVKRQKADPQHRLSNIDSSSRTATCMICGPDTPIKLKHKSNGSGTWRCRIAERRWNINSRRRHEPHKARRRKYGLRRADYMALLQRQHERCAICGRRIALVVDHCHETGRIRGLLCRDCNLGIGYLRDDPKLLRQALKYLKSAPAPRRVETGTLFDLGSHP
jgi:hypothetical protein